MTPDPLDLDAVEADARLYARTFNAEFPTTGGSTDSLAVASFDALMVSHTTLVTRLLALKGGERACEYRSLAAWTNVYDDGVMNATFTREKMARVQCAPGGRTVELFERVEVGHG